jgi:hypothetical protein
MDEDLLFRLTTQQRLERDMNELEGVLKGIAIDGRINAAESAALRRWCDRHVLAARRPPYSELVPLVFRSIADGELDPEERGDIVAAIAAIREPSEHYNVASNDMQRLHGVLAGVGADGVLNDVEVQGLASWVDETTNLRGMWPYDELESLITRALADGVIDPDERSAVLAFCLEFTRSTVGLLVHTPFDEGFVRHGVCATDPEIHFCDRVFCFTGRAAEASRDEMSSVVSSLGGLVAASYSQQVDFLVLCALGSAAWKFNVYGRKIESAMLDRRSGRSRVQIVADADFWDAVEDAGGVRPSVHPRR